MDPRDFERLKESVREMVAIKNGKSIPSRTFTYSGKVLLEVKENGRVTWDLESAADDLKKAFQRKPDVTPKGEASIRHIREQLRQTQDGFAELLGISKRTLQEWEQGRRDPRGPARTLLTVAMRYPMVVLEAVKNGPDDIVEFEDEFKEA